MLQASRSKTRYKPNSTKRAVDARADLLPQEYLTKAREADRKHNLTPVDTVGPVERKLVELGEVQGIVSGNFGEVSEATHALVAEAQKPETFRIAAFYAQIFSGRSARIHFSRHIKKRVVLSHDISKKCVTLSRQ